MPIVIIDHMKPSRKLGMNATPSIEAPEAASETFVKGALLIPASGYIGEAGADPTTVLGVALEDGHNGSAGDYNIGYCPALPGQIFEGIIGLASDIAQTDLFTKYGVALDAGSGVWYVDTAETSNVVVCIVGFKDPVGTTNGRVYFVFLAAGLFI